MGLGKQSKSKRSKYRERWIQSLVSQLHLLPLKQSLTWNLLSNMWSEMCELIVALHLSERALHLILIPEAVHSEWKSTSWSWVPIFNCLPKKGKKKFGVSPWLIILSEFKSRTIFWEFRIGRMLGVGVDVVIYPELHRGRFHLTLDWKQLTPFYSKEKINKKGLNGLVQHFALIY